MAAADFGWRFADARNLYGFYNGIDVRRTRSGGGSPPAHRGSHRPYPVSCAGMVPAPSHDMRHPKSNEERRATNGHDSCVRWAAQPSVFVRASSSERLRQSVFVRASSSERLRQSVFVRASSSERLRQSVFVLVRTSNYLTPITDQYGGAHDQPGFAHEAGMPQRLAGTRASARAT